MTSGEFGSRTMTPQWWQFFTPSFCNQLCFPCCSSWRQEPVGPKKIHAILQRQTRRGASTTSHFIRSLFAFPSNSSTSLKRTVSPSFSAAGTHVTFSCLLPVPPFLSSYPSSCPEGCDTQQIAVYYLNHASRRFLVAGTTEESQWLIHWRSFSHVNLRQKDWRGHAGPILLHTWPLPSKVTFYASCWKTPCVVEYWCPRDHIHFAGIASAGRSRGIDTRVGVCVSIHERTARRYLHTLVYLDKITGFRLHLIWLWPIPRFTPRYSWFVAQELAFKPRES